MESYRNLTRFSPPATGTNPAVSLYGGGQGIYIDNVQDRERVYVVDEDLDDDNVLDTGEDTNQDGFLETTTGLRDMRNDELTKMWVSRPLPTNPVLPPTDYFRMGAPANAIANASLEQKHFRGWVGPDEFRARGVEVELVPGTPPTLTITRDARTDDLNSVFGGNDVKTWKNAAGVDQPGVYRRTGIAWPTNGVIFAEGNIRIKGEVANAPSSLTVVSMGNIYIEDSLQIVPAVAPASSRKILLLASKNVVMNPTRVVGRPDAQTKVKTTQTFVVAPAPVEVDLDVNDTSEFRIGDVIRAFTAPGGVETVIAQGTISQVLDADTLRIAPTVPGIVAVGTSIRTPNASPQSLDLQTVTNSRKLGASVIAGTTDVIQRRFSLPATPTANLRFAFDHQGQRVNAFLARTRVRPNRVTPTAPIHFSNKGIVLPGPPASAPYLSNTASNVATANKRIRGQYTEPTVGTDEFPSTTVAPTLVTETLAQGQSLDVIKSAMNLVSHEGPTPGTVGWEYNTDVAKPLDPTFTILPFYYTAGVGNRFDFGATTLEGRKNINPSTLAAGYNVPFANSINLFANGAQSTFTNETYNLGLSAYDRTNRFGFNPNFMTAPNEEDVLTGDQSFYQVEAGRSTTDSRQLTTTLNSGLNTTNSLYLQQSTLAIPFPGADFPDHRVLSFKPEEVGLTADTTTGIVTVDTILPAREFAVNAFVYAQTGSWFVIPSGLFNDRLKTISNAPNPGTTSFLDINDNGIAEAGESILDTVTPASGNRYPDLNRNGITEDTERYAMARYSRYNYQINFTGAIAEGQTPIVNTMRGGNGSPTAPIVANGAVEAWMLSWSTIRKLATDDPATLGINEAIPNNGRMNYVFDDDYATGQLQNDVGFRLPQTTEIFNLS